MNQFHDGMDSQLAHYGCAVRFHCLYANAEPCSNFSVGTPFCEVLNDLIFPMSKYDGQCRLRRRKELRVKRIVGSSCGEEKFVFDQRFYSADKVATGVGLANITVRACKNGLANKVIRFMHGIQKHFNFGKLLFDFACSFQTVNFGHFQIEHDHLRSQFDRFPIASTPFLASPHTVHP